MKDPIDQLFQESLQHLHEIFESGLNNLHIELSSLETTFAANDGLIQRVLTAQELRLRNLERQFQTHLQSQTKRPL